MKKQFIILLLLAVTVVSCQDDQMDEMDGKGTIEFEGKNAVIKANNLSNIRFREASGSIAFDESIPKGQIRIEASENFGEWLEVDEEAGELRIVGKEDLPETVELVFHINPLDIAKIVVEGNNKVTISSTPVLDYLEIVTEGESELHMHNLKVRDLKSRREGSSRMVLSSELTDFGPDSVYYAAGTVELLDDHHIVYTEADIDYLLFAPEIKVRNDSVFALGYEEPLRSYFVTHSHELVNQGESDLDALELPTLAVTSKNEGQSEAKVWAMDQLQVKGEGESTLYYFGNPEISEELQGSAQLIILE